MIAAKGHNYVNGTCTNCGQDDPDLNRTYALRYITVGEQTGWYYANVKGEVDRSYTGVTANEYGWWYVENSTITFVRTGLVYDSNYGWWYVEGGKVNFNATGLVANEYGWWYVQNGSINFAYTGLAANEYGWWYVQNGSINFNYNGLASNENGCTVHNFIMILDIVDII